MGKLRIPHIIGMVLAGVAVGKYGFNILVRDDSFELFGKVGLYYIMFLASLEMDMEGVKRNSRRFGIFGVLTCGLHMSDASVCFTIRSLPPCCLDASWHPTHSLLILL